MTTYLETPFSGLIPAKLISRFTSEGVSKTPMVKLKLTANRGAYKRGEIVEAFASSFVEITSRRGGKLWVREVQP